MKKLFMILSLRILSLQCSDSAIVNSNKFGSESNGKTALFNSGDKFLLELDVHADGGYQWFHNISDTLVVKFDSVSYRPKGDKNLVGGLTVETFYFKALKKGTCSILLNEKRGWEKDISPITTVQFTAIVK